MGIDLVTFRARIGLFKSAKCDLMEAEYKNSRCKVPKWNISAFFFFLYLSSPTFSSPQPFQHLIPDKTSQPKQFLLIPHFQANQYCQLSVWNHGPRGLPGLSSNKVCHMIYGNRRNLGYKLSSWNCGRGLMTKNDSVSDKLLDIKLFIQNYKPSLFGIIESDIHDINSPQNRRSVFSKEDIFKQLHIDGYNILLPDTWDLFGQARIIVYAKEDLKIKQRKNPDTVKDLPSITLEIGLGREKRTLVNFYYREWTGGVSGDKSHQAQLDRFSRQVQHWKSLRSEDKDVVLLGDANFCSLSCSDPDYP